MDCFSDCKPSPSDSVCNPPGNLREALSTLSTLKGVVKIPLVSSIVIKDFPCELDSKGFPCELDSRVPLVSSIVIKDFPCELDN